MIELRETKETQARAEQEKRSQEMGMQLMSELFKNPEGAEKILPAMKSLMNLANDVGEQPQPLNRAGRRRQQRLEGK